MTEPKRCCEKCISDNPNHLNVCVDTQCPCHTPVSEPQVGFLRQYLNESPDWKGKKFTDEDLLGFIGIAKEPAPPPTEGTIQRLRELVGSDVVLGAHVESAVLMLLAEQKARMVEVVEAIEKEYWRETEQPSNSAEEVDIAEKKAETCRDIIKALSK